MKTLVISFFLFLGCCYSYSEWTNHQTDFGASIEVKIIEFKRR